MSDVIVPPPPLIAVFRLGEGMLYGSDGLQIGPCYAGIGPYVNNVAACALKDQGPLPVGRYSIGAPIDDAQTGPFSLPLTPDPSNLMFDRGGFLCHGDTAAHDHTASHGCPVADRPEREVVAQHQLLDVVA